MSVHTPAKKKITVQTLIDMKRRGEKISMLTAYDFTTARILDEAGIDSILVGDSAANVMAGYETTVPMTVDEMIVYAASVVRGTEHALVICDMPFGSYTNPTQGIDNAVRIMQKTGCDALKLEGGAEIADTVRKIVEMGIPVMGHLGLTPQSIHKFGGYGLRANNEQEAEKLMSDAKLLEEKKKTYAEYRRSREEMRELLTAKANVDRVLKMEVEQDVEKEKDHGQR